MISSNIWDLRFNCLKYTVVVNENADLNYLFITIGKQGGFHQKAMGNVEL